MKTTEAVCVGMTLTDILLRGMQTLPEKGQTGYVTDIEMKTGGDAINEAITLANLGHTVSLLTLVGDDAQGKFIVENCQENRVDTEGIVVSGEYPTSTSIVLIDPDGERSFLSRRGGTVDEFSLADVRLEKIQPGVKVVSIASLFCSERLNDADTAVILKQAKRVGAVTIADMVFNRPDRSLEDIKETLSLLDYIAPSRDEAEQFTGEKELSEIAQVFHDYGVKNVIIKLGKAGVYAHTSRETVHVSAYATSIVDTTGAGDNFMAGVISGLIRGCSLKECLQFGSATSAVSIGHVGATGAIKSLAQVQKIVDENEEEKSHG